MIVRRALVALLSLGLSATTIAMAPSAGAVDPRSATDGHARRASAPTKDTEPCSGRSTTRLRVVSEDSGVLLARGMVWTDGTDKWSWRFKHNADVSAHGTVKAHPGRQRAFQVTRSMVNLIGPDHFVFRAENLASGEVCRVDVFY
jgi:hypothetical protein